jgi:hypothetical protein
VPFAEKVVVKLAPVPLEGVPPIAVHTKVYGDVPPDPAAVRVSPDPTVPVVRPEIATARVNGLITIVAEPLAVLPFASVTVADTMNVPFALYIVVRLEPVPVTGDPPVAVHENV